MENMTFREIEPYVRFAADVYIAASKKMAVTAYDHRLFYIVSGNAVVDVHGIKQEVCPGTVLYWMSGTPYQIYPLADTTVHVIAVNFDFTQEHTGIVHCIPLVQSADYNKVKRLETIVFTDMSILNTPVMICDNLEIRTYLQAMLREALVPKSQSDFQLCNLMRVVLVLLCRQASQKQQSKAPMLSSGAILEYIQAHYMEDLDNRQLARQFNYHPNYLSQLITAQTGIPLHQYLIRLRIRQAVYLLQTTQLPINEIAHRVGFKSPSYFSHYFKQCTGHPPRKFRLW